MTPAVSRALQSASRWAKQEGMNAVLPAHILWALLEEEEGRAVTLLKNAQLDWEEFQQARPVSLDEEESDKELTISDECREILIDARELARLISPDREISSEALLVTLLRQESTLRQGLEQFGLEFAKLEKDIIGDAGAPVELDEPLELGPPREQIDLARIMDANANRAREALRVIEDYCRFVLNDAFLTRELKELRHGLKDTLSVLPTADLLDARETIQDVGTAISTESESTRLSLISVAQVNLKRLQEALRCLEENGKVVSAEMGKQIEALRYRSYTLERALLRGTESRERLASCQIQLLVTGATCKKGLESTVTNALRAGVDIIQLREKELTDNELLKRAKQVRQWTNDANALFIVNDRPDIARLAQADGVHLGQDDLSIQDARRVLGPGALIGVSTHSLEQVRQAVLDGADYIGIGPTFLSQTKDYTEEHLAGVAFVQQATEETSLPAFVIGGVSPKTLPQALATGAKRVAVSHCVCQSEEPGAIVTDLLRLLNS